MLVDGKPVAVPFIQKKKTTYADKMG